MIGGPILALAAAQAAVAGADRCAACHSRAVEGYQRSGMARSLSRPLKTPSGAFMHAASGARLQVRPGPSGPRLRIERGNLAAEYPLAYAVGSGSQGHSYIVRVGDFLFEAPASYYASRRAWGMSPGYEQDREPDFERPVTPECLFCHAGRTKPVAGTANRYHDPPFAEEAISCERCHGPADAHLVHPSGGNIVRPGRLPPRARDSICEQCHLAGEARVLNPGKAFQDFVPGAELEQVFAVYVFRRAGAEPFKVVSQAEQLALSRCHRRSGQRMWCGSCHNPHDPPAEPARYYRERCLNCHGQALLARHARPAEDCVACHMPRSASSDIAHTSFTDHRILRRPDTRAGSPGTELVAWREPPAALDRRNLGLAHISVGERDQNAALLNEGFRLLAGIEQEFAADPEVLSAVGLVLLRQGAVAEALRRFELAAAADPSARGWLNLAVAQDAAGRSVAAIRSLERAIALDPALRQAYVLLTDIYARSGQPARRREVLERYLRVHPQSLAARRALR